MDVLITLKQISSGIPLEACDNCIFKDFPCTGLPNKQMPEIFSDCGEFGYWTVASTCEMENEIRENK